MNQEKAKGSFKSFISNNAIVVILIVMIIAITVVRPKFMTSDNIFSVLSAASTYGCMAMGAGMIIITGGINLASGAQVAFAGVMGAIFGQQAANASVLAFGDLPFIVPLLITLLAGCLCGLINGVLIAKFNAPPFIVTLGMMTVYRGFALLITGGEPVSNLTSGYNVLGGSIGGVVPIQVIILLALTVLTVILLGHTHFGMDVYAIGSNRAAAEVSGVKTGNRLILVYLYEGFCCGVTGLILASRAASIHPGAADGYELTGIASCIIGGTSPSGGIGKVGHMFVGVLVISVLRNALTLLGVDSSWQQVAEGLVIVVAVAIDVRRSASSKK